MRPALREALRPGKLLSDMTVVPACTGLGRHCRELAVTVSVATLDEDDAAERDALATWLLGHRERIAFGEPYRRGRRLLVDAVVKVPCKYLEIVGDATQPHTVRCRVHGYVGTASIRQNGAPPALRHPDGTLTVVHRGQSRRMALPERQAPRRALPVLDGTNPCVGAPCRTADHTRGAACCRDLTLEVVAPAHRRRSDRLEALLLTRRSPYLCKTERVSADVIECEVISACGYLEEDGVSCALHQRLRPDGRPAKPGVCSRWPDLGPDDVGHPGCRLLKGGAADGLTHGGDGRRAGRHDGRRAGRHDGRTAWTAS